MRTKFILSIISIFLFSSFARADESLWHLGVGPAVGVLDSSAGYGGTIEFLVRPNEKYPVYVGLETGMLYFTDTALAVSLKMYSIPILPTVSYRFAGNKNITSYVGLGAGVAIDHLPDGGAGQGSVTERHFELLFKPGIEISHFFLEPKVGLLSDEFLFAATLGYRF